MGLSRVSYHTTVRQVYRKAAEVPDGSLCCVPQAPMYMPGLDIPSIMHEMNYGCGSTVHLQDMREDQRVLYVGIGGGLEALRFAYFARRPGGVVAIDPVREMREAARRNLELAARLNEWFDPSFVDIRDGDALDLPVDDATVGLAAQNCLFNIFTTAGSGESGESGESEEPGESGGDLERALAEMHRVLTPAGRLSMSDPVAPCELPAHLRDDETLRAQCISGCLTYQAYIDKIVEAGFGTVEVRSRRPYRLLDRERYGLDESVLLESLELCGIKVAVPDDGPCVFTGRTAIYSGPEPSFDDGKGHVLLRDLPQGVCDKTAAALAGLGRTDITVTPPTWHYTGDGCC